MAESGAERTEQATPKRLEEARKKGQVPRSTELSIAAVCIAAAVAIYSLGRWRAGQFADLMRDSLSLAARQAMCEDAIWPALTTRARALVDRAAHPRRHVLCRAGGAPGHRRLEFLRPGADAAVLAAESRERHRPHVLGARLVELGKGLAKVPVVGAHRLGAARGLTPQLMGLSTEPLEQAIGHSAALTGYSLLVLVLRPGRRSRPSTCRSSSGSTPRICA